ncbi:MAG TPA: RidA family protein [Gaiellaceae bacterium]|jgi:enamine deaminase RidA (YjgF/YER057c/UK114 family)|nr:RidA family protein [Gaiellaceae bacterium]
MEKRQINPWSWQDQLGFSQAWRVEGAGAVVYLAGQGPISAGGELVGAGDFEAQVRQTFRNIGTVLEQAGVPPSSLVKLSVYLTDIGTLRDYGRIRAELFPGPPPASTAVQVGALAIPGMMIEIDAIAVA